MKKSLKYFILSGFVLLLVALAACGSDSEEESDAEEVDTSGSSDEESATNEDIEGSVVVDGSGTVYPLMALLAENYMTNEQQGVSVEVGRAGTSAGFEKFLIEDGTDFNDASRQIKPEEKEKAEELNIEVKELKVALDGLTIVTHPENDWATELTEQQVIDIFLADGGIETWSDVNADWPDEKIQTYGPNENHGTYEFFYEEIMGEQDLRDDVNLQQEYSQLVNLISEDKNGIGFFWLRLLR